MPGNQLLLLLLLLLPLLLLLLLPDPLERRNLRHQVRPKW